MTSSLTIVTPWHNHLEYADAYWDAIYAADPEAVIVVDNASDPPLEFAGVRLEQNSGFCGGCNTGLHAATTDYVLFLNNDIELRTKHWLDPIRAKLDRRRLIGELRFGPHSQVGDRTYSYIDGWCIAAHCEDLIELGGWDDTLQEPAYYSDNMLSLAAARAGWELTPTHIGLRHISNGTSRDNPYRLAEVAAANREIWATAIQQTPISTT